MRYQTQGYGSVGIGPGGMTPGVKIILLSTVGLYVLQHMIPFLMDLFVLRPIGSGGFLPWQPLTYMFIHAPMPGVFHILFNMFAFWMFGVSYEREFGRKRLFALYFSSGILTGLVYAIFVNFGGLIGASAGVYAILVSFAYFWPNSLIFIFGLIPVRAKYLVIGLMAFGLFASMSGGGDNTAHFAHVLGAAFGFIFLQIVHKRYRLFGSFMRGITDKKEDIRYRMNVRREEKIIDKEELTQEKIDELLAKVSKDGISSLTKKEREFLDRASKGYR